MQDDYKQEFECRIEYLLDRYMAEQGKSDPDVWRIGAYSVEKEILKEYLGNSGKWEEYYERERAKGKRKEDIYEELEKRLPDYPVPVEDKAREAAAIPIREHAWYNVLSRYQGRALFYMTHTGELDKVGFWAEQRGGEAVLLTEVEVPEDTVLPEQVVIIDAAFPEEGLLTHVFLEYNFPLIFHYFNLFDLLVRMLRPVEVVVGNEKIFQSRILAEICRKNKVAFEKWG